MEENQNTTEQEVTEERPDLTWKQKFVLYLAIILSIAFAVFAIKIMNRADIKPSELLDDRDSYNILREVE